MDRQYIGWAVKSISSERTFLAGILYFFRNPIHRNNEVNDLLGIRTMVFRTRQQAREAKATCGYPGDDTKYRVVKVRVTVDEIPQ